MAASALWVVECPVYTAGPFRSEESAQRIREHVEALGACMFDHEVREVSDA